MARIEVPMPQMGESIAEGTVSKWLKQVGDTVERDEPILEISTDKVDAEIPSPQSGTLVEVAVEEGETVEVGTIVAYIDTEADDAATSGGDEKAEPAAEQGSEPEPAEVEEPAETDAPAQAEPEAPAGSAEERLRTRSTPVVRKIAEEHGVDIASVTGTGHAGRVTKQDILEFIDEPKKTEPPAKKPAASGAPAKPAAAPAPSAAPSDLWTKFYKEV
ncbi:MAG: biotin/lipoyl-containing protein, partial [Gemmatimonadota bacterium]